MNSKNISKKVSFRSLSASERRVLIAKDVIKSLQSNYFTPRSGTWVKFEDPLILNKENYQKELCDLIKGNNCQVCGIGAIFVSAVTRFNNLKVKNVFNNEIRYDNQSRYIDFHNFESYLRKFFGREQLCLIENAFECYAELSTIQISKELRKKCQLWGQQFATSEDRMIAIMRNIIRNKGSFVLPKRIK